MKKQTVISNRRIVRDRFCHSQILFRPWRQRGYQFIKRSKTPESLYRTWRRRNLALVAGNVSDKNTGIQLVGKSYGKIWFG
jgi:hypothetical protein